MHSFCVYIQSLTSTQSDQSSLSAWSQGVDSLAQWLEHWIFDQEVLGSNLVGVESFSAMPYFLFVMAFMSLDGGSTSGIGLCFAKNWLFVIINDDFLEMGVCYEYLHKADHA